MQLRQFQWHHKLCRYSRLHVLDCWVAVLRCSRSQSWPFYRGLNFRRRRPVARGKNDWRSARVKFKIPPELPQVKYFSIDIWRDLSVQQWHDSSCRSPVSTWVVKLIPAFCKGRASIEGLSGPASELIRKPRWYSVFSGKVISAGTWLLRYDVRQGVNGPGLAIQRVLRTLKWRVNRWPVMMITPECRQASGTRWCNKASCRMILSDRCQEHKLSGQYLILALHWNDPTIKRYLGVDDRKGELWLLQRWWARQMLSEFL